ncbi:retinol-binding protein pinta-like [Rhodnius prolixus]|uniref:retinol-binding protein pinta-like n=1 Tax=Rhodnius prolixus TaxID=13249 RepID=UPI003D18C8AD
MWLEELPEEQKDLVLEEFGYSRKQLDSDLEQLKEWLKLQHHLPAGRLKESDSFLKMFLAGCKGSLEKAKRKLDAYYTYRSHTVIFDCRDPFHPDYMNTKYLAYYVPTPKLTKHTRFAFFKLADENQEKFSLLAIVGSMLNVADLGLRLEKNFGVKCCILFDAKNVTISNHIAKLKPLVVKDFIYYTLKTMPYRYSNFFVINAPEFVATAVNTLILPLMSKKMRSRMYITANGIEEVSHYFDKSVLPKDYGGDLPSMKTLNDFWKDLERDRRDWFVNELTEQCDESKRIVMEDPANPYFGLPGSLKKLVVD